MILRRSGVSFLLGVMLMAACGGEEVPDTPLPPPGAIPDAAQAPDTTDVQGPDSTQLVREVFSYRGSGRDPFMSLLKSGDARPLLQDLRVSGITYDSRFPARSVAILRDTTVQKRYSVRVGDELGRLRVSEIRRTELVLTFDDFGVERQVTLPIRRRQEGTP